MKSVLAALAVAFVATTASAADFGNQRFASCNVFNVIHYTGETIIELESCQYGIGSKSIRLNAAQRDTFLLNKLYSTFATRTALGLRTTEIVFDRNLDQIGQVQGIQASGN